jgi:hypothetical protein
MTGSDIDTVCKPNEAKGCTEDGLSVVICAEDGSGWTTKICLTTEGMPSECKFEQCLMCSPLAVRCAHEDLVEICNESGTAWMPHQTCYGETTGQRCKDGACTQLCSLNAKYKSYLGCEYWAVDLDNAFEVQSDGSVLDAEGMPFAVIVSNPDTELPMKVTIKDANGLVTHQADGSPMPQGKVLPMSLRVYELPRRDITTTLQEPLAYQITTSIPALAYQFNPLADYDVFSNDASLLLPSNALDRWYLISSYPQTTEAFRGFLAVVGMNENTTVTVRVTAPTLPGDGIPALKPGESITVELAPFEVLNLATNGLGADLTGSEVVATRAVAVFAGAEAADVPAIGLCDMKNGHCVGDTESSCSDHHECTFLRVCCADHLEQAQLPVDTWGQHYHAARTYPRGVGDEVWRIMAANDDTVVSLIPPIASVPVLNSGEWIELRTNTDFEIISSRPVSVSQFLVSEHYPASGYQPGDAGIGDPAFMLVPPIAQYRQEYVVLTPPSFEKDYINIISRSDAITYVDDLEIIPSNPLGTGDYFVARIPVDDGIHTVVSTAPCGVSVYGWSNYVSYAYPGGLDLAPLNLASRPRNAD